MTGTPFGSKNVAGLLIFPQGNSIISSKGTSTESIPRENFESRVDRTKEYLCRKQQREWGARPPIPAISRCGRESSLKAQRLHVVKRVDQGVVVVDCPLVIGRIIVDIPARPCQETVGTHQPGGGNRKAPIRQRRDTRNKVRSRSRNWSRGRRHTRSGPQEKGVR